jgi:hypothetical protein
VQIQRPVAAPDSAAVNSVREGVMATSVSFHVNLPLRNSMSRAGRAEGPVLRTLDIESLTGIGRRR